MKIIEFFGLKVKPRITKGKHMFKPMENGVLSDKLCCIRDKDANCFLYKTDSGYLAIDSGYKKSLKVKKGLDELGIRPQDVHSVFLTHLDIDHAGGMDLDAGVIFPEAKVYLSRTENEYLKGKVFRKEIGPIRCKMPIRLTDERILLEDREIISCDGIGIEAVYSPGHSYGHTAYRIGNELFVGDCVIFDGKNGWCFYDFWNYNSNLNKDSLKTLANYCEEKNISRVISSHSGMLPPSAAFTYKDISPNWREKGFNLIPDAEDNLYK